MVLNIDLLRLCTMRCFRPENLMFEIKQFIRKFLGKQYADPPPFNFVDVFKKTDRF